MKTSNAYEVKNLALEVKDIDPQTRRVKIALSAFDNIDSDGDVIRKGAFAKSIMERGSGSSSNRKIAFLRYHDWEHQIGKFISMEETHEHLIGIAELGNSTKGNDALHDYRDGIIIEHSIGFNFVQDKTRFIEMGGQEVREASEVILWEGSAVTFGANSLTPTLDVSKGEHIEQLTIVNKEMEILIGAIKNGKGTDDRQHNFEMRLKVLQTKYNSLIEMSRKDYTPFIEPNKPENNNNNFYKHLI